MNGVVKECRRQFDEVENDWEAKEEEADTFAVGEANAALLPKLNPTGQTNLLSARP